MKFKKKQTCVNEMNLNVFEKDKVLLSEKIFNWEKLSKLIEFWKSCFCTNCVQTLLQILICQCVMICQSTFKMSWRRAMM